MTWPRPLLTLAMLTVSFIPILTGCEADPIEPSLDLAVSEAKPVRPPKDVSADFELKRFFVEAAEGTHGFTDNSEVNADIAAYLDTEIPVSQMVAPTFSSWSDYLGCPTADLGCSAVTLVMNSGKVLGFYAFATPVVAECGNGGTVPCILDPSLDSRWRAMLRSSATVPWVPWERLEPAFGTDAEGNTTFTFYWQGQRGVDRRWDTGEVEKVRGKIRPVTATTWNWDLFPDLQPEGGDDIFFFQPAFQTGNLYWYHPMTSATKRSESCDGEPGCLAGFTGEPGSTDLTVSMEESYTDEGVFEISVKALGLDDDQNPESFGRVMMRRWGPSGSWVDPELLAYEWENHTVGYRDPDTGVAATWYRPAGLVDTECYRFDLVGLIVHETEFETFATDNRLVWDGTGVEPILYGNCSTS